MEDDQTWYRQLLALVILSASRAAVDFITKPGTREEASSQLRDAVAQIDFEQAAAAVSKVIDDLAANSKDRLSGTIDTLRDKSHDVVDEARSRAEDKLAPAKAQKKGFKMRFLFGLILGGIVAYFVLDEQRRDDLLDRLTGASGPIQSSTPSSPSSTGTSFVPAADKPTSSSSTTGAPGQVGIQTPNDTTATASRPSDNSGQSSNGTSQAQDTPTQTNKPV